LGSIGAVLSSLIYGFHHTLMVAVVCYFISGLSAAVFLYLTSLTRASSQRPSFAAPTAPERAA
jgi:hypothetical protein